jgi:hypothetical protein
MKSRPQNHFEALLPNGQIAYSQLLPYREKKGAKSLGIFIRERRKDLGFESQNHTQKLITEIFRDLGSMAGLELLKLFWQQMNSVFY